MLVGSLSQNRATSCPILKELALSLLLRSIYHHSSLFCPPSSIIFKMSLKATILILGLVWSFQAALGIRFVIDREECFSHKAEYEGDTLHVSFVVIKSDSQWHFNEDGVDLVIHGPTGEQVHDFREQISAKHDFVVQKKGVYRFCFTNKSPYHETIDFDVQLGHFAYYDQHAKDGEDSLLFGFVPVMLG
ncbi:hypothetical protein F2Q68_00033077 [Brassica cretica]|uniref:GOLD domain-containing protein n=1 Tax=Brassica cretica TaxID=69181 RepID=A0A8S9G9Z8_BRACR|nr:hypothetical protein F2Q68_00033077 [Brassica cretica]